MASLPVQSTIKHTLPRTSFPTQKPRSSTQFKRLTPLKPTESSIVNLSHTPLRTLEKKLRSSAAIEEAVTSDENISDSATPPESQLTEESPIQKVGTRKPRLVLKFIWMEKNIGVGLDQEIPRYGTVPLSPYFFWPRKDAWEELKTTLESKPWISQKKMIILLNQATDIINLWQQSGGNLSS